MEMNVASIDRYREQFSLLENRLPGAGPLRRAALERFAATGFPTTRDEDWKYTNVASIERRAFRFLPESIAGLGEEQINQFALAGTHLMVFVNGCHVPALSHQASLPQGVSLTSLAAAMPGMPEAIEDEANAFSALNAAFWMDGACLELAAGVTLKQPIHLLFIGTETDLAMHPRNLIRAAAGSHATIIEHFASLDDIPYFTNAVTCLSADQGATIEHIRLQQESARAFHVAALHAQQGRDSRITSHAYTLGALLSRNGIDIRLDAEGAAVALNGLYIAGNRQHVDHHTCIDHAQPRCLSRETYKGVLDGAARAVFHGKIIVRPDAQKSDARQTNRNLLLSEQAEVDSRPQLEIHADDVKCAHGATVGQLDEQQLFYLRSRGVDASAARTLLIHAFAREIIALIDIAPLRERLEQLLISRLSMQLPQAPVFGER